MAICRYNNRIRIKNTGEEMVSRFVVVPAIPTETGSVRNGARFYSSKELFGFNIYDNKEKCRLSLHFPTRSEAETVCELKNSEQLFSSMY